jgi:hypothetical protein
MNQTLKRHLISAGITFISNFGLALAIALSTVPADKALTGAVIWGIIGVAARGAVKATTEAVIKSRI